MAQNITVVLTDDVDGSEATETVRFALDGIGYEIDLNSGNAEKLRDVIREWISHARRSGAGAASASGRSGSARSGGKRAANPQNAAIRDWARANGHEIGGHGRVPAHVRALYELSLLSK